MLFCLGIVAVAVAEDASSYSYQNRMPFYGNYPLYNGKIINHYGNYGYRSPLMYGNKLPKDFYGQVSPKMYGNKPPKKSYGYLHSKAYSSTTPSENSSED